MLKTIIGLLPGGAGGQESPVSGCRETSLCDYRENDSGPGVFWHTQGAGKSYSMVMFTRKIHRKLGGNFTFLVLTDRDDLDTQIYKTFAGCGVVDHDREPCRAASGKDLRDLLQQQKAYVFSLIQKFNQDVDPEEGYTRRNDVIVITDEAHRTQYGTLALNMRNALPAASFIGFTGTPLFTDDEITRRIFGDIAGIDFRGVSLSGDGSSGQPQMRLPGAGFGFQRPATAVGITHTNGTESRH